MGTKIIIRPEQLAVFQHAPLSVSEEVQGLEREHLNYEDLLAFLATDTTPNPTNDDPRPAGSAPAESAESAEYAKYESIDALLAHVPQPVEHIALGDKNITMLMDDSKHEVWFLSHDDSTSSLGAPSWVLR